MLELISGDWQLDSRPPFDKVGKDGHSIRFNENVDNISAMLERAKTLGCTALKFLGDVSENKNPDSLTGKGMARLLRQGLDYGWEIDALGGNHDGSMFHLSSSSLEPLAIMAGSKFRLHHELAYALKSKELFLPYLHKHSATQLKELIGKTLGKHRPSVGFGHYGVANCTVGPRNLVLPGDLLTADVLYANGIALWFMGHIHKQQVLQIGDFEVVFVGSPTICDFGEREDPKGFATYDTESGEYELHKISPKRRWMVIDFGHLKKLASTATEQGEPPWCANDLLCVSGTHDRGEDKTAGVEKALKALGTRPFLVKNTVELAKSPREIRGEEIARAEGFREAAKEFVRLSFADKDPKVKAAALELVLDRLSDQRKRVFGNSVIPQDVTAKAFMTFEDFSYGFSQGVPTLIYGENGIGKTNVLEALLFLLSGETSKNVELYALVRQGSQRATVSMTVKVDTGIYRIIKSISLKKDGGAKQEISLEAWNAGKWEDRSDGKNSDVQAKITEMVGAGFLSLKATNFLFQEDTNKFIQTQPGKRKAVFAELLEFEPIAKAHRVIKDLYLATKTALDAKTGALQGMEQVGQQGSEALPGLEHELKKALQKRTTAQNDVNWEEQSCKDWMTKIEPQKAVLAGIRENIDGLPNTQAGLQAAKTRLDTVVTQYSALRDRKNASHRAKVAELEQVKAGLPDVATVTAENNRMAWITGEGLPPARGLVESLVRTHAEVIAANGLIASNIRESQRALNGLQSNDIGVCSRCKRPLDTTHLEAEIRTTKTELASLQENLAAGNVAQKDVEAKLAEARRGLKALEDEESMLAATRNFRINAHARALSLAEELGALVKEGKEAKEKNAADVRDAQGAITAAEAADREQQARRESFAKQYRDQEEVIHQLELGWHGSNNSLSQYRVDLQQWESAVKTTEDKIVEIRRVEQVIADTKAEIIRLTAEAEIQDMACAVLDPKTGLPIYLIDIKLPFLEDRINHYMDVLGSDLGIRLTTMEGNSETLAVLVDNGVQPMLDIASYSGGQHDRMEIAIKLALGEMALQTRGIQLGLLCYDEPGVYFDDAGKAGLIRLLFEKCAGPFPVTLVISHDAMLVDSFDNKLNLARGPEKQTVIV